LKSKARDYKSCLVQPSERGPNDGVAAQARRYRLRGTLASVAPDYHALAFEFKAFPRSQTIKTPAQLLQVVMSYWGVDEGVREVAGNFTLRQERLTDPALHKRLKACGPWRLVIVDGSSVQGPGARGTGHRLPLVSISVES
jgi:hypothetical protein